MRIWVKFAMWHKDNMADKHFVTPDFNKLHPLNRKNNLPYDVPIQIRIVVKKIIQIPVFII
jgi:hypothetical protein